MLLFILLYSVKCISLTKQELTFYVTLSKGLCDISLSDNNIEFGDIPVNDIENNNVEEKSLTISINNCTADINASDSAPKVKISGNTIYNSKTIFNNKYSSPVGFIFKNKGSSVLIENDDDIWHYDKNNNSLSIDLDINIKCLNDNCQSVKEGRIYSVVKFSFFYY